MSHHLAGLLAALAAAALYSVAVGLQAWEARRVHVRHTLRLSLLDRLARRPLWIAGAIVGAVGWGLQALALSFAPLTLVEPALAASLVFLLAIGARGLHEQVGPRETLGVLAVASGVAGLGLAAPAHSTTHAGGTGLVLALLGLGAVVALPHGLRGELRPPPALVATSAGVAYAVVGLATKFAVDDAARSAWAGLAAWLLLLGVVAGAGVLSEMSALQLRPATQVAPLVFGLNVVVPVVLAPLLAGESWNLSAAARSTLALSLAAVVAGVLTLSRSEAVGALLESEAPEAALAAPVSTTASS